MPIQDSSPKTPSPSLFIIFKLGIPPWEFRGRARVSGFSTNSSSNTSISWIIIKIGGNTNTKLIFQSIIS
ncbi:hypothetical protein LguiB_013170 [Lonicera macranthoides]